MEVKSKGKCWVGLDWGDREHSVCIMESDSRHTTVFQVKHNPEGMAELFKRLSSCGEVLGVCVETHRHLVVQQLLLQGFTLYSVNPKIVKSWRESVAVQPSKSDEIDAETMARGLCYFHDQLRRFKPDEESFRELAMLCEDEMSLIEERTALVNKLQAALKQYYPQALDFIKAWTKPTAWDFLLKYPNPDKFKRATKKGLTGFLKIHRIGISPKWEQRINDRKKGDTWRFDKAVSAAKEVLCVTLAKQLKRLEASLKMYRKRIDKRFKKQPDAGVFMSLPGCGEKLAPRLLSMFGTDRTIFDSARGLQQLSGVAPVSTATGGKKKNPKVIFRRAVKTEFRDTMHQFAWCSTSRCEWAKAVYNQAKQQGDTHGLALRKLGSKWLKIIYRMWKTSKKYDESKYLHGLIRHGSPLVEYMKRAA
ncbi:MAG: IS110 family transposase [Proteobacteria bacterium]|nr:IS110 family transposase [Pseudomonadota bacterium]